MTLFLPKNLYFLTKHSFMTTFLVGSYFATHPITLLLKILGGRMHGPSPTSNLGGPSPHYPSKCPPMLRSSNVTRCVGITKIVFLDKSCIVLRPIAFTPKTVMHYSNMILSQSVRYCQTA